MLIEREIGDEPFQSAIFFFELAEPPQFAHHQMGVLLLPGVERGVTHPELPQRSPTGVPASACRIAGTICSSENVTASWVRSFRVGPPKPSVYSSYDLPSFSGETS